MNTGNTHRYNVLDPAKTVCGREITDATLLVHPEHRPTCPDCQGSLDFVHSVTRPDPVLVMGLGKSPQMGMGVHYVRSLGLDGDGHITHILCQAALVVGSSVKSDQPRVHLAVFSSGANMMPVRSVAYDKQRSEVDTWHHLMDCDQ